MEISKKFKATVVIEFDLPTFLDNPESITHKTPRQYAEGLIDKIGYRENYLNPKCKIIRFKEIPL